MTLPGDSPCVGARIGDLRVAGGRRPGRDHPRTATPAPPDPDGSLEAGDELLFVSAQDDEQELAEMLAPAERLDRRRQDADPQGPFDLGLVPPDAEHRHLLGRG